MFALAAVLSVSCKKENNDENGTWICYKNGSNIAVALILDGKNCDYQITSWGERYTGTYTYSDGVLKMHITKFWSTINSEGKNTFPDDETSLDNFQWTEHTTYYDKDISPWTYDVTVRWQDEKEVWHQSTTHKWFNANLDENNDITMQFIISGDTAEGDGFHFERK